MLGQRRRRWTNIKPTLGQRLVFAERRLYEPISNNNNLYFVLLVHEHSIQCVIE